MSKQEIATVFSKKKGYCVSINGEIYNSKNKKVKLSTDKGGYLFFSIRVDKGNSVKSMVHKLQAYQKFGDKIFDSGIQVRHLNGLSYDNSYDNIAIGSQSDNRLDIPKEKRIIYASHPKYNHSEIIKDRNDGMSYMEIMHKYNITSKGTVFFIINKSLHYLNNFTDKYRKF